MNLPKIALPLAFKYTPEVVYPDGRIVQGEPTFNLIPQAGIDLVAAWLQGNAAVISNWYVAIYEGNYVPTSDFTAADMQTLAQECQAYTQTARPTWNDVYDGTGVVDNAASRAIYTMNADKTIYGAVLISNATKGGVSGTAFSIARFNSPQVLVSGAEFRVTVGITLIPTAVI